MLGSSPALRIEGRPGVTERAVAHLDQPADLAQRDQLLSQRIEGARPVAGWLPPAQRIVGQRGELKGGGPTGIEGVNGPCGDEHPGTHVLAGVAGQLEAVIDRPAQQPQHLVREPRHPGDRRQTPRIGGDIAE